MIQISVTLYKRCGGNCQGVYFVRTAITSYSTLLLDHLFYFCPLTLTSGLSRQLVNKKCSKREDIIVRGTERGRERPCDVRHDHREHKPSANALTDCAMASIKTTKHNTSTSWGFKHFVILKY